MDIPSSPLGTSEGSLYEDSTPPTTPASSPLFGASRGDELASSSFPSSSATYNLSSEQRVHDIPCVATLWRSSEGQFKNVCVVGAGYVGTYTLLHDYPLKVLLYMALTVHRRADRCSPRAP